jgi:hypothetical protein
LIVCITAASQLIHACLCVVRYDGGHIVLLIDVIAQLGNGEGDADGQGGIASEVLHESNSCAALKSWDMEDFDGQPWCLPNDKSMQGALQVTYYYSCACQP